jgi:fatty-acyl-CoA synthase
MHPCVHARNQPDTIAFVLADTGEQLTYRELEQRSNRWAHAFRSLGLSPGDRIGVLLRNSVEWPIAYWAAQRSGLTVVPLSTHLKFDELAYILRDCGARGLITSHELGEPALRLAAEARNGQPLEQVLFVDDAGPAGSIDLAGLAASLPDTPIGDEISGYYLPYSSGTTGRPKGIILDFEPGPLEQLAPVEATSLARLASLSRVVTFNGAPLYHAAPLVSMIVTLRAGGTAVFLRKFDAEQALRAIQDWRVTYAQFVPTMFVRILALDAAVRKRFDLSSLELVIHAAAPCPVPVKQAMFDLLGPIVHEYYSGSEANGQTYIRPEEWLAKPGSVGRAVAGIIHICDDDGNEVPAGTPGLIYFESNRVIRYLNDPAKSAAAHHPRHASWSALGDIGYLDADGYLYLTDRRDFMIISGGVNIYPQIVEDCLIMHPAVLDVAVFGVPDPEFGEAVKAVIQLRERVQGTPELARAISDWCRSRISRVSCPRFIEFVDDLPRLPTGKLAKHQLKRQFGGTLTAQVE